MEYRDTRHPSPPTPSVHPPTIAILCATLPAPTSSPFPFLSLSLSRSPLLFPFDFPSPSSTRVLPASPRTDIKRRYVSAGKWTTSPQLFASLARTSVLGDDEGVLERGWSFERVLVGWYMEGGEVIVSLQGGGFLSDFFERFGRLTRDILKIGEDIGRCSRWVVVSN